MYSEKIKKIKHIPCKTNGITLGDCKGVTKEQMKQIVLGFCTKDDIRYSEQSKLLDLFEEYCNENGYPVFNRKTAGYLFKEIFGVTSTVIRIGKTVKRIYI